MKKIIWMGSSLKDLQDCPEGVKDDVGFALYEAQQGEMPNKSKPLKGLLGVIEIKSDFRRDTYRTVYTVKLGESLYVLHVFKKKSHHGKSTPKPDMQVIKSRLMFAQKMAEESK
ncbi:MAG: addiction module toxin RelE [Acidithiobacillus sp.]|jgi:phage-related protein|nr:MAG: addiction module toxin RelE [Acidithiobacillus sp.]|tara:strand:- start:11 stop:352 length:342 start_codon:yes stop_codon:yes gene_type:complete